MRPQAQPLSPAPLTSCLRGVTTSGLTRHANGTGLRSSGQSLSTHGSISQQAACRTASAAGLAGARSRPSPRTGSRARSFPEWLMEQFCREPLGFSHMIRPDAGRGGPEGAQLYNESNSPRVPHGFHFGERGVPPESTSRHSGLSNLARLTRGFLSRNADRQPIGIDCMFSYVGTRFPESPIPSRVPIAIGPGAPPRGQLHAGVPRGHSGHRDKPGAHILRVASGRSKSAPVGDST